MDEDFKVCVVCKSEFEGEGDKCEVCVAESGGEEAGDEEDEEGVDQNER